MHNLHDSPSKKPKFERSYEIVNATIPKKELFIGKKCTYAVKYLRETNFNKSKCKISKELSKVFEKMGSGD